LQGKAKKGVARVRTSLLFHRPRTLRLPPNPKFPASFSLGKTSNVKSHYNIVKYPLTTESAMNKIEEQNTIVFIVDPRANKHQIKRAVETLYGFKTLKVSRVLRSYLEALLTVLCLDQHVDSSGWPEEGVCSPDPRVSGVGGRQPHGLSVKL
jgi:hypothetical protein